LLVVTNVNTFYPALGHMTNDSYSINSVPELIRGRSSSSSIQIPSVDPGQSKWHYVQFLSHALKTGKNMYQSGTNLRRLTRLGVVPWPYQHRVKYKCTYKFIHTYIHAYIHRYICTCIHTYIYKYICTCIHTYIHIYITPFSICSYISHILWSTEFSLLFLLRYDIMLDN